ncbi:MAG: hypothetical protein PVI86_00120 [Phycisphaerae bacterium]
MSANAITRMTVAAFVPSLLLAFASGCAPCEVNTWAPKPVVHWEQVATQPVQPVVDGYRILAEHPTRALFPASMAVTRVSVDHKEQRTPRGGPLLMTDPRNEFLQWNSTLDNQMAISEVFPIVDDDLGGGQADPQQIVAAFRALHAGLGLIYAVNELSPTESEMFGVLYDIKAARPIASLHKAAASIPPPDDGICRAETPDPWVSDSRALVRAEFDKLVHTVIRELILRDEPAPIEVQTGWRPPAPARSAVWPPPALATGR